ncbi:uncharacterized protein [Montipora foliosa]|uniref:uncharacterized protein n=1 Tax=Montipora foliosa TaxID=591990 RepID=UPI0035F18DB5
MASIFIWGGRLAFSLLILAQCILLASYPANYKNNLYWYLTSLSYIPSTLWWFYLLLFDQAKLRRLFYFWGLYVLGLVVSTVIVFAIVGDSLDKERFLGPNVLKMTLCITPPLLLLLLRTAEDAKDYEEFVSTLCFHMVVDLFDAVEMLDIVLDEKEHNYGIPKEFGVVMIAVACISFLLSPWQMAEKNLESGKLRRRTAIWRYIVEILFVNFVFLVVRLVIMFEYNKEESIFVAKNGIAIILGIIGLRNLK